MGHAGATTGLAALVLAVALAGCGTLLPSQPTPPATAGPPGVPPRPPGPVDTRLERIDPAEILGSVAGGKACRPGTLSGSSSSDDSFHTLTDYTCPRLGDDRNVYFEFVDAYEAALRDAGATLGGGGKASGDATQPIETYWDVRGDTRAGTARVLGENGPGTLRLFVSLDLLTP